MRFLLILRFRVFRIHSQNSNPKFIGKYRKNHYTFLFQNTDSQPHEYYFEVIGSKDITISRPKESFKLNPGSKVNKVVVLSTDKELVKNDRKDTPIPIKIRAFAVDKKDLIVVDRDAVFFYPSLEVIKQKAK